MKINDKDRERFGILSGLIEYSQRNAMMAAAEVYVNNTHRNLIEIRFQPPPPYPAGIDLPFEASDVRQGNSHQSKNQEDPHVGSELDLASQPALITPTCPQPTNHHPGSTPHIPGDDA